MRKLMIRTVLAFLALTTLASSNTGWSQEFDGNLVFQLTNQSPNVDLGDRPRFSHMAIVSASCGKHCPEPGAGAHGA